MWEFFGEFSLPNLFGKSDELDLRQNSIHMKKNLVYLSLVAVSLCLSSCAAFGPVGVIYTQVNLPQGATSNEVGTKVGTSQAISILGLVATGDASINAAAK